MRELTKGEIIVTDTAKAYFLGVLDGLPAMRLSIVSGKGCGGNEYKLEPLTEIPHACTDMAIALDEAGHKLLVPAMDFMKFFGTTIDYITDALGNTRVEISNPNETGRCGCGQSAVF